MSTATPRTLLADLATQLGLPDLTSKDPNACTLLFEGEVDVTLETDAVHPHLLHAHTFIATVPPEKQRAFYARLLRGNYLGEATGGAVLALNPAGEKVVLQTAFNVERCDLARLAEELPRFVQLAQACTRSLSGTAVASIANGHRVDQDELEELHGDPFSNPAFHTMIRI